MPLVDDKDRALMAWIKETVKEKAMRDGRYNTTPAVDRRAAQLRAEGLSFRAIGEVLGVSDKTAKQAAERGLNGGQLAAETVASAELRKLLARRWHRLTDQEREVMERRKAGDTLMAIGAKLDISKQRVQQLQVQAERILREER